MNGLIADEVKATVPTHGHTTRFNEQILAQLFSKAYLHSTSNRTKLGIHVIMQAPKTRPIVLIALRFCMVRALKLSLFL